MSRFKNVTKSFIAQRYATDNILIFQFYIASQLTRIDPEPIVLIPQKINIFFLCYAHAYML